MSTCTLQQANPNTQGLPAFYQENLTRIYQFVYVQVKNREVAEDLTSQVFLKAVRHLDYQRWIRFSLSKGMHEKDYGQESSTYHA